MIRRTNVNLDEGETHLQKPVRWQATAIATLNQTAHNSSSRAFSAGEYSARNHGYDYDESDSTTMTTNFNNQAATSNHSSSFDHNKRFMRKTHSHSSVEVQQKLSTSSQRSTRRSNRSFEREEVALCDPTKIRVTDEIEANLDYQLKRIGEKNSLNLMKTYALIGDAYRKLYKEGRMTDITVVYNGQEFRMHKAILFAQSKFAESFLAENADDELLAKRLDFDEIGGFKCIGKHMQAIIDYMYCGQIKMTSVSDAIDLLAAATKLQIKRLCTKLKLMIRVNTYNCITILEISDDNDQMEDVWIICLNFFIKHFIEISLSDPFQKISNRLLAKLLSDERLPGEMQVLNAAIHWLNYDSAKRKEHAIMALSCVRYYWMTDNEIIQTIGKPAIMQNDEMKKKVLSQHYRRKEANVSDDVAWKDGLIPKKRPNRSQSHLRSFE